MFGIEFPAPTAVDRLVGMFSPKAELNRLKARAALRFFGPGGYSGASKTRPSLKAYHPRARSADEDILGDVVDLRARSRDLVRNTPIATGALNTMTTHAVGSGLALQSQIDREFLGLSDDDADAWERQAERLWRAWSATSACDITGHSDFGALQDLVLRSTLESGDILPVRRFVERRGDVLGLKVQLIEADRISNPEREPNTDRLVDGVEFDANGRPVRYHVANRHPNALSLGFTDMLVWTAIPAVDRRSGERRALHVFRKIRPGQTRGVPIFAPVIEPLKQLGRYTDAELMAAVVASFFTVFVKSGLAEQGLDFAPLDPDDTNPPKDYEYKLGSGSVVGLADGEEVQIADPKRPNDRFDPFVMAVLRQVGAAIEVPFELLVKHFTSSYSASRAALLEAWRAVMTRRTWLARMFCQPSYEWAIAEAVTRGMLRAPGFFANPMFRRAWCGTRWIGPAQGQIDPLKEINAAEKRLDVGVSTIAEETAQFTGGDWERNHAQQVKEKTMRQRDGLGGAPTPPTATAVLEEPADAVDKEEDDDA